MASAATMALTHQQMAQKLVTDLRSRSEENRCRAARELFAYVSAELREDSSDELAVFLEAFTKHILELIKGDSISKLGGILAILALINAEVCNTGDRISRFGNYLRNNCLSATGSSSSSSSGSGMSGGSSNSGAMDMAVIELASKTLARLTQGSGSGYTANIKLELIDHEVKRAFEQLGSVAYTVNATAPAGVEGKRYGAVLILREVAFSMPTFFFQNVSQFFDVIFCAIYDPKPMLREAAVNALRAGLVVTAQRETTKMSKHQHESWYTHCYNEVMKGFDSLDQPTENKKTLGQREDKVHGSLLALAELLRCSNATWEHTNRGIEETILQEQSLSAGPGLVGPERNVGFKCYYQKGFKMPTQKESSAPSSTAYPYIPQSWFGTIPVGREPVIESALCKRLLSENFNTICKKVLAISRHPHLTKSAHVQNALLLTLPKLAAFRGELFVQTFLAETMQYMERLLQDKNRYNAFVTIGLLAVALGNNIEAHLRNILVHIKLCLPSKDGAAASQKKRVTHLDPAIFACISMLARALKQSIKSEMADMLDSMLSVGLSPALTTALHELAHYIPAFQNKIADGLLKILSVILMQQSLRHPGMPRRLLLNLAPLGPPSSSGSSVPPMSQSGLGDAHDSQIIVLGLRTLGSFNFEGHSLLQFVRHCADTYLHSEEKEIRLEAVRTCSSLLRGMLICVGNKSQTVLSTINDVLAKLLIAGITDGDPVVRKCVLDNLDCCFDYHLAQAENLSALFIGLNDEVFEIREQTISIIGRLGNLNPAYVMPSLRCTLMQLLTEMEYSGIGRNKEQSARMLGHLVANAPSLIKPYVEPIIKVLVPKLKETDLNPMVITSVTRTIGDLAQVGSSFMQLHIADLLPLLLDILNDASSAQKREVSLWTMAQLLESTGYVVLPYQRYPQLLETLLGFLRTDQHGSIRSHTLRLLGLLGALDPYKHKMLLGQIDSVHGVTSAPLIPINDANNELEQSWEMSPSELLVNLSMGTLEEFYPSVAIASLMKIIRDPMLSQHHTAAVQAVTHIFRALGIKSVPYIPQVIPSMINVIRTSESRFHENLFRQIGTLVGIVHQHIRNYLEDIFALIKDYWTVDTPLSVTIIGLVESISMALGAEFKIYLPILIPQILRVLAYDTSRDRNVTAQLLNALKKFGNTLHDYMHLILPKIVVLFDQQDVPVGIRRSALQCIDHLSDSLDFSEYASLIIHPLVRCLDKIPELRQTAMDALTAIVIQLGKKYVIFIPMVQKVLIRHKISHQRYEILCVRILQGGTSVDFEESMMRYPRRRKNESVHDQGASPSSDSGGGGRRMAATANLANLQEAWAVTRRVSKDDWLDWYSRLCSELLKASPSPALKACGTVAQHYQQLAKDLFNASFVSCWTELDAPQQDELISSLEQALTVPDLPEISQTVLNLAEFMEHCDRGPLPLEPTLLGEQAIRCRAYAKALHYKEEEFLRHKSVPSLEALISINNKLGQKEAAAGLLEWGRKNLPGDLKVQERWYEKLHDWQRALGIYKSKADEAPKDPDLILGRLRCLEALGEWGELYDLAESHWPEAEHTTRLKMTRMAASAAWGRKEWHSMARYVAFMPREGHDGTFFRAVLAVHNEKWNEAQELIDATRALIDTEVTALSLESYQRAYPAMVNVQMLAELEEVIEFKLMPERQPVIKKMWWDRLQGCQRVVEDWQRILHVRSLVISPQSDQRTWLKYASLCRSSGRLQLAHRTLVNILGMDPSKNLDQPLPTVHPHATYEYCKHLWCADQKAVAFNQLSLFVRRYLQPQSIQVSHDLQQVQLQLQQQQPPPISEESVLERQKEVNNLLARCYHRLGRWQENLQGLNEQSIGSILQFYTAATENDNQWYKAWHSFAVMNFESVLFYKQATLQQQQQHQQLQHSDSSASASSKSSAAHPPPQPVLTPKLISSYAVPALRGFVRSITLSKGNSLQDTLRLLTLLFDYGHQSDMYDALHDGLRSIEIDNWLQVIPQLIARIDTPRPLVSRLIHQILTELGKHHPQALVYSLTVAAKSSNASRKTAANKILTKIREHSDVLVTQALMVSDELIRVAILWHEQWHEGLEEASRLYFGERNIPGMLACLEPLHAMLEKGPQTLKETSFNQAYGNDLSEAKRWCQRYKVSVNTRDLNQAWDLYYHVFRRISRQLPKLTQLELQYVSPKLLVCSDLELAVPGSYVPNGELIRISQVQPSLQVITSKQRPRKLCIKGSNGRIYMFLLKGHEDLRQDERVMQFFSLVNSLLLSNPETFRRNLAIQRFAVIPLSTNSGLIGWVPHSDTLHGLIKDYREKKKILLNIEHRIMQRMAPNSDHLPLMNKVEVFEHSLEHTQGDDLAKLMLLKAPSSEVWFERRNNFTRSLAVMSMVGYVLGLGDRHPSNLLLDRMSGKILHIDFGDCFEVAMTREKFPEKIPFRLTRMLIMAMEVTGIEGTYRSTCESVMHVLRDNKDSLMAVLEAFVYDPLLNWRLMEPGQNKSKKSKAGAATNAAASGTLGSSVANNSTVGDMESLTIEGDAGLLSKKNELDATEKEIQQQPEALNKKALEIIQRVRDKLTGRDFSHSEMLDVAEQVDRLIEQATNNENLCQSYIGWCPFW